MKKIAIVLFVASAALAGCSKKKANTTPSTDTGSAAPAGDTTGSDATAPAGSDAAPAGGEGGGSAM